MNWWRKLLGRREGEGQSAVETSDRMDCAGAKLQIDRPSDNDRAVRRKARGASRGVAKRAVQPLIEQLSNSDAKVRVAACEALGNLGNRAGAQPLIARLSDCDENVRVAACGALGNLGDRAAVQPLVELIGRMEVDQREFTRLWEHAFKALADLGELHRNGELNNRYNRRLQREADSLGGSLGVRITGIPRGYLASMEQTASLFRGSRSSPRPERCDFCAKRLREKSQVALLDESTANALRARGRLGRPLLDLTFRTPSGDLRYIACMDCLPPDQDKLPSESVANGGTPPTGKGES